MRFTKTLCTFHIIFLCMFGWIVLQVFYPIGKITFCAHCGVLRWLSLLQSFTNGFPGVLTTPTTKRPTVFSGYAWALCSFYNFWPAIFLCMSRVQICAQFMKFPKPQRCLALSKIFIKMCRTMPVTLHAIQTIMVFFFF